MTTPEWISIIGILVGQGGAIIIAQRLQANAAESRRQTMDDQRHRAHTERADQIEERLNETSVDMRELNGRLVRVETTCNLRHAGALPKGA